MKGILGNSISRIHSMLRDGALTSCELCSASLHRVEQVKPLNAFISVTEELARYSARQSSERYRAGVSRGFLDGIPIAVKDNFCTVNVRTTCGSRMLQSFIPKYNATVVQKLVDAGAVLLGKCNMDEFAMGCGTVDSVFGPTKNVWQSCFDSSKRTSIAKDVAAVKTEDDWYIPGGSSGGSAIAVASGAAFFALGSDTGGSTRNPAAYCGIVGFKPTFGVLSRHGLIPLVNSMDVPGILTRTTEDASIVLNMLAGWDPKDSTSVELPENINKHKEINMKEVCVGIPSQYESPGLSKEVLTTWNYVADLFESAGSKVVKVSLPHTSASISCYSVLNQCEVASNMARFDGIEFGFRSSEHNSTEELFASSRREGFGEVVRSRILAGNYFLLQRNYQNYFVQAMKVRRLIVDDFEKVWTLGVDVLLTPTTLTEPPKYSEFIALENQQQCVMQDYCTQPVNLAGYPAVSLPIKLSRNGLPISLQLIEYESGVSCLFYTMLTKGRKRNITSSILNVRSPQPVASSFSKSARMGATRDPYRVGRREKEGKERKNTYPYIPPGSAQFLRSPRAARVACRLSNCKQLQRNGPSMRLQKGFVIQNFTVQIKRYIAHIFQLLTSSLRTIVAISFCICFVK